MCIASLRIRYSIPIAVFLSVVLPKLSRPISLSASSISGSRSFDSDNKSHFCNKFVYSLVQRFLLLLSGNVHTNPGPVSVDFNIIHINCRSLNNDKLSLIDAESTKFDIITLSETWLKDTHSDAEKQLSGFHNPIRKDRENNSGYGGVAIFVRNNLFCKHRPDLEVDNLEAVWVETRINGKSFLIGSFYRPPNARCNYWDLIAQSIQKANSIDSTLVILGDFNSDFNQPQRKLLEIMNNFNLQQLVHENTRKDENTATCIDLIFTQTQDFVREVTVYPEICSDHCCPCIVIKNTHHSNCTFKRTFYNYSKLRINDFKDKLVNGSISQVLNNDLQDVNTCAENFSKLFFEEACKCMPTKKVTVRDYDKPWVDEEMKNAFNNRYKLFKLAQRTDSTSDWTNYRVLRNQVTNMVRQKKNIYDKKLDDKASSPEYFGTNEFYKLLKHFLNKKGQSEEIPPLEFEGKLHFTNLDKANALNDHFINQTKLENPDDIVPDLPQLDQEIKDIVITSNEIKKLISKLDKKKASGPDNIHNRLLISAVEVIAEPLAIFFTRCLSIGIFPSCWKRAHVTPLFKKGSASLCSNYRPISLLSCVGKLFERCVHGHVFNFLVQNHVLTQSQSGFIPGDSTVNQLVIIYDNLCRAFDDKITTQSVFFDISKAFDKVWHKGLLYKLHSVGIRGNLHRWFTSYLSNREQCVVLKGKSSDFKHITAGVPQGSVLGPLLFLIYINDITLDINSIIKLFADDTSLSLSLRNPDDRANTLNQDLEKINIWAKKWKIKFNAEKTELLNFKRDNLQTPTLTFDDIDLTDIDTHKHLGLIIQNNCKWDSHIDKITQTVTMLISFLKSYKYRLSRKTLNHMYKSFILPHFDYCDIIYDNCTQYLSDKLENLHLEAIRTIVGAVRGTSHQKLYEESGFTSLGERRKRHKLIFFHKIVHNACPSYLSERCPPLVAQINHYHRRRPLERHIPRCRTDLYSKSFFPEATRLYNELPDDVKTIPSIGSLKHFLNQSDPIVPLYYYGDNRSKEIWHTRLRLGMSDLNYDLFRRHLVDDPACSCGYISETAEHFLMHCTNHTQQRAATIGNLPGYLFFIDILLKGNTNMNNEQNKAVFDIVQDFIELTGRF